MKAPHFYPLLNLVASAHPRSPSNKLPLPSSSSKKFLSIRISSKKLQHPGNSKGLGILPKEMTIKIVE